MPSYCSNIAAGKKPRYIMEKVWDGKIHPRCYKAIRGSWKHNQED